jgi:signal transduction histidine kinase
MSADGQRLPFEASAHLQTLIGRELFRTEESAVIELIKNAYDSDATRVIVTIRPQSQREPGEVEIRDDGVGMGRREFERLFMVAGYSEKDRVEYGSKRIPTGEKGIGRFASDRIGHDLVVLTKKKSAREGARIEINWDDFASRRKKFSDVTANYREEMLPLFDKKSGGTILRISRLRSVWTPKRIEALRNSLSQLIDPYVPPSDFEIDVQAPGNDRISGVIEPVTISSADIDLKLRIKNGGQLTRILGGERIGLVRETQLQTKFQNLAGLRARFFLFLQRGGSSRRPKNLEPGVRLFRDGFRVEPFGHDKDWLGIAERKASRAGHAQIDPKRLFGVVSISRRTHLGIRDTTSREALLDSEDVRDLVTILKDELSILEELIREEFTVPKWEANKAREQSRKTAEFETARLQTLGIMAIGVAHDLRQPLQTIRLQAENIARRLGQLDVEDALISECQTAIDRSVSRIDKRIRLFASISSGTFEDEQEIDLARLVNETCEDIRNICTSRDIELTVAVPSKQIASVNETLVIAVLTIILNNAIEALDEIVDDRTKRIIVTLTGNKANHTIEISDNADGIPEEIRANIFQRFTSQKPNGMGLGLNISRSIVRARNGDISFKSEIKKGTTFTVRLSAIDSVT